jgi:hypothetical protein
MKSFYRTQAFKLKTQYNCNFFYIANINKKLENVLTLSKSCITTEKLFNVDFGASQKFKYKLDKR